MAVCNPGSKKYVYSARLENNKYTVRYSLNVCGDKAQQEKNN